MKSRMGGRKEPTACPPSPPLPGEGESSTAVSWRPEKCGGYQQKPNSCQNQADRV